MAIKFEHTLTCEDRIINLNFVCGDLYSEYYLTCDLSEAKDNYDLAQKYELLTRKLIQHGITPIHEKAFGFLSFLPLFLKTRSEIYRMLGFSPDRIPFSYIEGVPAQKDARWAGVHLYGVRVHEPSQVNIKDIEGHDGCCGKIIESKDVRHVYFTGLIGEDTANPKQVDEKTEINNIFTNLDLSLQDFGFQMSDLARTWFHLRDILPAYHEFNQARRDSFTGRIDNGCLPASTAIQGRPSFGREICLDALAIQSRTGNGPTVRTMTSPAQPEAKTYGPLFSRGMEIIWPGYKVLHVSGTASIDEAGRSVHTGDPELQISNTLNNISLLLNKYGATMTDIVQACAYFKNPELEPAFNRILRQNSWQEMPCLRMRGDVCRDDLFFEMDCIAVVQV